MNRYRSLIALILCAGCVAAQAQSFNYDLPPQGWQVLKGDVALEGGLSSTSNTAELQSEPIDAFPVEVTYRVKPGFKQWSRVGLIAEGEDKPALQLGFFPYADNATRYVVTASGEPMQAIPISSRPYSARDKPAGSGIYTWRYPTVKNLWDDRDRAEIGSSYESLTPFDEKLFVVRLVLTETYRQIWLDDRMVAEKKMPAKGPVRMHLLLTKDTVVRHASVAPVTDHGKYLPVQLTDYASDGSPREAVAPVAVGDVPVLPDHAVDFDLGDSLYRYRLSVGSGPDAGYVNGRVAWPDPMHVDPAIVSLRVPYRAYKNIHLLAWVDDDANSTPAGAVRFYRHMRGNGARMPFRIDDQAIADGLVTQTDMTTADGKSLYLVRVPVDSEGFYNLRDTEGDFLDVQITKPLQLSRSYPDPIYYGQHPGGLPSSVHVVGITFEEADFTYEVEPLKFGHVFERPEIPQYNIHIRNLAQRRLGMRVQLETTSYDGNEKHTFSVNGTVDYGGPGVLPITLGDIKTLGWHELRVTVTANGGDAQTNTLSLVLLPPDPRTYGFEANEVRIGAWLLLGHYQPFKAGDKENNTPILEMFRRIGLRRMTPHSLVYDKDLYKKLGFLPKGQHTIVGHYHRLNVDNPEEMKKFLEDEWNGGETARDLWPDSKAITYYFGGEWNYDHHFSYMPFPRFTGGGAYTFDEAAMKNMKRQMKMFYPVAEMFREKMPNMQLILQWGAPANLIGFLEQGFKKEYIDGYGMDAPMFELTPEVTWMTGGMNQLWQIRQEIDRLGYPQHKINWCEGPFLPTNEGALTERQQAENHVRYWLMGLAYGIENFEAGFVPFDAANYYGSEHYGAGVFHAIPKLSPKPAVASLVTAANMTCGADVVGPVDTGVLTTYCLAMKHASSGDMRYALWRVVGEVNATLAVTSDGPITVTDSMGNETSLPVKDGKVTVQVTPLPIWITGATSIDDFTFGEPIYQQAPVPITEALPDMTSKNWRYDGSAIPTFAENHFAISRQTDDTMTVTFDHAAKGRPVGAAVTLPVQSVDDRPLTARYGAIVPTKPVVMPGKAAAIGLWLKGNSSWGRVVYQVSDAKGELWTSIGAKDDWNCDDTYTRTYAKHEGWRYVRFPLPGNQPWDQARELETTWWKHEGGDGIVQLPLKIEKIILETRNTALYLGEMKVVPDRSFMIAGPVAEYADEAHKGKDIIAHHQLAMPTPKWQGPTDNPIARMAKENEAPAPTIKAFEEPGHFNDGRRMVIRIDEAEGMRYKLYLSRYKDGRGADTLRGFYKDMDVVRGFRPGMTAYLFMTAVDAQNVESKPSAAYELTTEDKFREK